MYMQSGLVFFRSEPLHPPAAQIVQTAKGLLHICAGEKRRVRFRWSIVPRSGVGLRLRFGCTII